MNIERPNAKPLSQEERIHLKTLKSLVEKALEDGRLLVDDIEMVKSIVWADGKVTYEELRTIRTTVQSMMGDVLPEIEWLKAQN